MNKRTPGEPDEKAVQDETAPAQSPTTDPPASAVRPSGPHPSTPTGDEAKKGDPDPGLDPKPAAAAAGAPPDRDWTRAPPPDLPTRLARLAKRDWHGMIIHWHMKKFRLTKDEAAEIFQSACLKALKEEDWPAEEKPTLSWLFTITRNTYFDQIKAQRKREKREVPLADLDFARENDAVTDARSLPDSRC